MDCAGADCILLVVIAAANFAVWPVYETGKLPALLLFINGNNGRRGKLPWRHGVGYDAMYARIFAGIIQGIAACTLNES